MMVRKTLAGLVALLELDAYSPTDISQAVLERFGAPESRIEYCIVHAGEIRNSDLQWEYAIIGKNMPNDSLLENLGYTCVNCLKSVKDRIISETKESNVIITKSYKSPDGKKGISIRYLIDNQGSEIRAVGFQELMLLDKKGFTIKGEKPSVFAYDLNCDMIIDVIYDRPGFDFNSINCNDIQKSK